MEVSVSVYPAREGLGHPAQWNLNVGGDILCGGVAAANVEFQNTRDHDDGLRPVAILEHCEFEGFSFVDEEAAAEPLLILHDPMAVAVLPDAEQT